MGNTHLKSNRAISLPDMGLFASLIFLLVSFYMIAGHYKWPDESVVPENKMAYSTPESGCHLSDCCSAVIGLNEQNQRSFSTTSTIQFATIQTVAQRHHVAFTPTQLVLLQKLPYLATNVENLPVLLSLSDSERNKKMLNPGMNTLSEQQLIECITTAKTEFANRWHSRLYLYLQVAANTKMSHFNRLTDMLQMLDINRFQLMTLCKRTKGFN